MADYSDERHGRSEYQGEQAGPEFNIVPGRIGLMSNSRPLQGSSLPSLGQMLEEMGAALGGLHESITILEKKLGPILIPVDEGGSEPGDDVDSRFSSVQRTVDQYYRSIRQAISRVQELERLANL